MSTSQQTFGELRGRCLSPPEARTFDEIVTLFELCWSLGEAREQWLPYAMASLEAWPDTARVLRAEHAREAMEQDAPWAALVRVIDLRPCTMDEVMASLQRLRETAHFGHLRILLLDHGHISHHMLPLLRPNLQIPELEIRFGGVPER